MKKIFFGVIFIIFFIGCSNKNIDLEEYSHTIYTPINVPDACKAEYQKLLQPPKVAVLKFTNNSNFGVAKITNLNNSSNIGATLGISQFGIGAGAHQHSKRNIVNRVVDPKLDKAIISSFESVLTSIGSVQVYSREDLQKIINEQKLQQSGLFDDKTIVKLGKLIGVEYIITGSIDAISFDTTNYSPLAQLTSLLLLQTNTKTKNKLIGITGVNLAAKALSGTKIKTTMTFKIIDVKTGEILFSKQITKSSEIASTHPTYSQIIGAVKYNIINGLKTTKADLSQFFTPKGYILQVKANKDYDNVIAQINLGYKDGIKAGDTFKIYKLNTFINPITHKTMCDIYFMNTKLVISPNQLQAHRAWSKVKGDDIKKVKPGDIIEKIKPKKSFFSF
jgi:curli biogenesis system outer membrane secretion channel CsgG